MHWLKTWQAFAAGSAFFAALTAVFGKIGVADLNSNLATLIRTVVILVLTALIVSARGEWEAPRNISLHGATFLVLSGVATGLSWLCYYRALQLGPVSGVAPIDKLSVALVIAFGVMFFGEHLTWQSGVGAALVVCGSLLIALS